jgi:hypothetical protein
VSPLAGGTEAVELFIDRATQAGATFDESQRRAIGEICVRLDGIPLAIELAAARARMMSPSQIADRLDQRFRLLTGGGRTAVERHRTLQATVSWSYELLDGTERAVFQRLSTLAGSFDLDAAEAIGAGGIVEGFEVLDAVGHLVDKSMVLTVPNPTGVRYRLLETLRQFATDRLADQPDATEVQDRHALYWRDRAVALGRATGGTDQNVLLDAIDADLDNYRTAFAYLLSAGRVNDAARGVLALVPYWQIRRTREGLRWYQQLLTYHNLDSHRRLRALSAAARAQSSTGDVLAGERSGTEAVQLAETVGVDAPWGAFEALMVAAAQRQDAAAYRRWWERGHQVVLAGGQPYLRLLVEAQQGLVPGAWDDDELIEHHERLQQEVRRHGDPMLMFLSANTFAGVLHHAGHTERARDMAHSAVDPGRRAGPISLCAALIAAAVVDVLNRDTDDTRARASAAEALRIARDEGLTLCAFCGVVVAAALAAQGNDIERSAALLAGLSRHGDPIGISGDPLTHFCRVHTQTVVDAHPGDLTAAQRRGDSMTLDDLLSYALDTLS